MKRKMSSFGKVLGPVLLSFPCAVALAQTVNVPSANVLPFSAAATNQPGFIWNIAQVTAISPARLVDAETIIAGSGGPNLADPNAIGTSSGTGTVPADPTAPITFVIPAVINFSKAAPDSTHNRPDLPPEDAFTGVPGTGSTYDNFAAEALTWLALPAGQTKIGVRSDDGFRLIIGGAALADHFSPNATVVLQHDGNRSASDDIININVSQAGLYAARLLYYNGGGNSSVEFYTFTPTNTAVLVNDIANGGIAAYRAVTTPPRSYISSLQPASSATGVSPKPSIVAKIVNGVGAVSGITLTLDGTSVSPTVTTTASGATVSYTVPDFFNPLTTHTAALSWSDQGTTQNVIWSFTTVGYPVLSLAQAVTPDTTKAGFRFNIFANSTEVNYGGAKGDNNFLDFGERGLNGLATDSTGAILQNFADLSAVGPAIGVAPALAGSNAPAQFQIATTINLNGTNMPGWPATDGATDPSHSEILTYVQLPQGLTTFNIVVDGHYRAFVGSWDYTASQQAGSFDGPLPVTNQFFVSAPITGFFPLRVTYYNVSGTPNLSISTLVGGQPVLLNDTAHGGLIAYRAIAAASAGPYVRYTTPRPVPRQTFLPSPSVLIRIQDRDTQLDDTTPALTLDGHSITLATNRIGDVLELTYTPTNLQTVAEIHSALLTFKDKSAKATTNQWSFMNLKSIWLPASPVDIETFDSYPEGTLFTNTPAGNNWYVWNFSAPSGTPGFDLTNPNSDAYLGFVVVGASTFANIEGDSQNVAPFEMLNGAPITALSQGNILAAESDNRADTYPGQVQFAISRRFNLSNVSNAVLAWSSIYKQNQNSFGGVEYSVDGQKTWLPVIYYLDGRFGLGGEPSDVLLNFDGTVNPALTLAGADAPAWFNTNGVYQSTFAPGLAAPISPALSPFFAPRIDDDGSGGKRLEVVRLPLAGGKSDVRIRFCQLGLCSWYIAADNIAFYDIPLSGATIPIGVPTILSVSQASGSITIKWSGGTLQSTTDLGNPNWQPINNSGSYTEAMVGNKFFRVSAQ